jgi:peroxiredoxin
MVTRAKTLGLQFPYVVDSGSTVARAFGAERTPEVFVFDAQGKLATTARSTTTPNMPTR